LTEDVKALRVRTSYEEIDSTFNFDNLSFLPSASVSRRFGKDDEDSSKPVSTDGVALLELFAVNKSPVVGIAAWGKGRIIVTGDPQCFTNILVSKDDNATFVTNILQTTNMASNKVIFYEYGNGYERLLPGAGLIRLIDKHVRTGLVIFTVAFLLLLVLEAQRFGAVRDVFEKTRFRSEYLTSLADLLKRGGGSDVVLDELGSKFIDDVTNQLGLSNQASNAIIIDIAKSRGLENPDFLLKLLIEAQKTHESVSDDSALLLVRQWYKMRKELSTLR
jgi:hypothetical protein